MCISLCKKQKRKEGQKKRGHTFQAIGSSVLPRLIEEYVLECADELEVFAVSISVVMEIVWGLKRKNYVLLVFVEISGDPGHGDDEGEDGEAYD